MENAIICNTDMKDEIQFRENCRNIKLIVCDLDGTLLKDDKTLSAYTLDVLRRVRKKGIFITFCTARVPEMAQTYVKLAEVEGPFIACAGALIWDTVSSRNLYAEFVDPHETVKLLDYCGDHIQDYGILTDQGAWFSRESKRIQRFVDYNKSAEAEGLPQIPLHYFEGRRHPESMVKHVYKVAVNNIHPGDCQCIKDYVKKRNGKLSYLVSESEFLDVFSAGVSKGKTLERLAGILGISVYHTCAFGDFISDNSMLETAGIGVAMGNAAESTKNCADYITDTNEQDGVAAFLERFIV